MFGNEEENKNSLPNSMRIALLTTNNANPDLPLKIQEKILKEKNKNIEFIFVDNVKDLFKFKEIQKDENIKGLIDKNWINNLKNLIPSVIIIYYELKYGQNKESDEKAIYGLLEEIGNYSKFAIIFVILVSRDMKENPYNFNFNDRQKPFYLKNFIQKERFFILPDEQIWNHNNEFSEICIKLYNCSFQFYKLHHRSYKEKRSQSSTREEKIENDIKLGVISKIKTKKKNYQFSKYLEEAYELLCDKNFDPKTYSYGSQPINIRNNFFELRATGDWLFFKNNNFLNIDNIIQINTKSNIKNINLNEIIEQIKKFERHIKSFSNLNYYDNGEKDYFHFVEFYWLSKRYKKLREYLEEINKKIKLNKKIIFKWFLASFKEIYNIIKIIKYYDKYFNTSEFKLTEVKINDGKILNMTDIEEEENIFYGKPPIYYYINKENENKKELIGFNDEIYIKKFIIKNQIKYKERIENFKNNIFPQLNQFVTNFKNNLNNNNKSDNLNGINLYLNLLKNIGTNNSNKFEIDDIEFYLKIIKDNPQIKKFPKVHINLIRQLMNLVQKKIKEDDSSDKILYKKELFKSLSILGNLSILTQDEENLFYELLNDTTFSLDKQMIINLNYYAKNNINKIKLDDLSFNFTYDIKNINKYPKRKILDIIEYELKFDCKLSKEKTNFNSLQLFFEYSKEDKNNKNNIIKETILKEFNKEELSKYDIGINSFIIIPHKLLIKNRTGKITLNKIVFTLCKKENIFYSISLPYEIDKTIFLLGKEADIMNIIYPNKVLLSGINQLYKFSYSINKKNIDNIKIIEYKHLFTIEKADNNTFKTEIFGNKISKETNKLNEFLPLDGDYVSPSIFFFNEEKNEIEEIKENNNLELNYNNFESRLIEGKTNFDVLFKFFKIGTYLIKLDIYFTVLHEEVDTKLEFHFNKNFFIKVINPFSVKYSLTSNNYSINNNSNNNNDNNIQKKEFLTDTPIKMNLLLNNELKEDIIIKDIQIIQKENQNYEINTTLKDMIDSKDIEDEIKEEIFKISDSVQYTIPLYLKFKNIFNNSIGKFKIIWTTKSLKEFEKTYIKSKDKLNLRNETEFDLPNINIKKLNYKFDYNYEIKDNNIIHLFIKIENKSKVNKRLFIQIGNSDETAFIISGLTSYCVNLKQNEKKNIFLKLYVIQNGEIKLPDVIVKEVDYEGRERARNNFYSEKIILN